MRMVLRAPAWVVWEVWICRVFVMAGLRPP
jgi:hypothetical protein